MSESNKNELPPGFAKMLSNTLPFLSVNCIIFRFREERLEYVVSRVRGTETWLVPGGFIYRDEDVDKAAARILFEGTGIAGQQLSQFGIRGRGDRSFASIVAKGKSAAVFNDVLSDRVATRSVTITYYSIFEGDEMVLRSNFFFDKVEWKGVGDSVLLGMDHAEILGAARAKLRSELQSKPVLQNFLPSVFTMPDLQALHEAILDRPIDRGNFRRRILKRKFLVEVGKSTEKTGRRPRKLYRFDEEKYLDSLTDEVKLGF